MLLFTAPGRTLRKAAPFFRDKIPEAWEGAPLTSESEDRMSVDRLEFHFALRDIAVDRSASSPIFRQIADQIRTRIETGALDRGARLPAIRKLSEACGVSRNTVVSAYDQLIAEGFCEARQGSGVVVSASADRRKGVERNVDAHRRPVSIERSSRAGAQQSAFVPQSRFVSPMVAGIPDIRIFPKTEWGYALSRASRYSRADTLIHEDAAGFAPLRRALADYLRARRGVQCEPEQIFVINGAHLAYQTISTLFADAGDVAIVESPGYAAIGEIFRQNGHVLAAMPVDGEGADMSACAEIPAKLIFTTPTSQIPLGVSMTLERRKTLLRHARKNNSIVIEADYAGEFSYADRVTPSLHQLDADRRVFFVSSFSATMYSTLRIACVVAPPSAADALNDYVKATKVSPSLTLQVALADFIESGAYFSHIRRSCASYERRLRCFLAESRRAFDDHIRVSEVAAGLVASVLWSDARDDRMAAERADQQGLPVWPVSESCLGAPRVRGLTMGFAAADEAEITTNIRRLADLLNNQMAA